VRHTEGVANNQATLLFWEIKMRNMFVISDTHFNHANILKFARSEFTSVEQMNETIIENWNKTVGPDDLVYHLGDFSFTSSNNIKLFASRLNGRKRLILGNHDYEPKMYYPYFQKISSWRQFGRDMFSKSVFLCHYPLHHSAYDYRIENEGIMIHGHLHRSLTGLDNYVNVCVEHTNYTPVSIEDIVDGKFKNEKQI
jgi:calcineurin-like phosphoesterase family protein